MERIDDDHRRRLLVARHALGGVGRDRRTISEVAAALALLHSTDPSTPYLSIQARTGVDAADIDAAFYVDRTLLRHTTVRRTVFAMPLDVVPLAHGAFNATLVPKLRTNLVGWIDASASTNEPGESFLAATERNVLARLRAGPATGTALANRLPALRVSIDPAPGASYSRPIRITSKVLELLAAEGRIARGRPTGASFTSGAWTWEVIDDWLGRPGIEPMDPADALAGLVDRYLSSFGPATVTDLTWWCGLPKGRIRSALARVARAVELDGVDEPGYIGVADELAAPTVDGVVALLPGLDSTTMGWKQRSWYVDDDPNVGLFDRNGNAGPTVWLDGRVIGAWTQRPDGQIVTDVPDDLDAPTAAALGDEVERLTGWLGEIRIKWRYPTPRTARLALG